MDRFQSPELCYKGLWLYGLVAADAELKGMNCQTFGIMLVPFLLGIAVALWVLILIAKG